MQIDTRWERAYTDSDSQQKAQEYHPRIGDM